MNIIHVLHGRFSIELRIFNSFRVISGRFLLVGDGILTTFLSTLCDELDTGHAHNVRFGMQKTNQQGFES